MSAFGITPVTNMPAQTAGEFPQYLQFQADGENLGGRDADTLNFGSGLTATRGVGVNANKVTLTAAGGGSASELLVSGISTNSTFDGSVPTEYFGSQVLNPSADVSWDETTATLTFARAGLYAITVMVRILVGGEDVFPTGFVWYGVGLVNGTGPNPTKHPAFSDGSEDNGDRNEQCFTDTVYYNTVDGMSTDLRIYAESADHASVSANFEAVLNARFIGAGA